MSSEHHCHGNYHLNNCTSGSFRLYDQDHDGYITKTEMQEIVGAIYKMVVRILEDSYGNHSDVLLHMIPREVWLSFLRMKTPHKRE